MDLPKYVLHEIAINLNIHDIKNFSLMAKKCAEITKTPYFWKSKRLLDYPDVSYSDNVTFSEQTKYKHILASGHLYVDDFTQEYNRNPAPKSLIKKIISIRADRGDGLLLLTFDGLLYMIDYDIFSYSYIGYEEKPYRCLGENICDVYYYEQCLDEIRLVNGEEKNVGKYFFNVLVEHENGSINKLLASGETIPIWENIYPKKYVMVYRKNYDFALTYDNKLYIRDSGKIIDCLTEIKDFDYCDCLYYLKTNGKLWCDPKYSTFSKLDQPLMMCSNILDFSSDFSSDNEFMVVDIQKVLYKFKFPTTSPIELMKIDKDVDFIKHTTFNFLYMKNNTDLYYNYDDEWDHTVVDNDVKKILGIDEQDDPFGRIFYIVKKVTL